MCVVRVFLFLFFYYSCAFYLVYAVVIPVNQYPYFDFHLDSHHASARYTALLRKYHLALVPCTVVLFQAVPDDLECLVQMGFETVLVFVRFVLYVLRVSRVLRLLQ